MWIADVVAPDTTGPALDSTHGHVHSDPRNVGGELVVLHNQLCVTFSRGHLQAPLLNVLHLIVENVLLLLRSSSLYASSRSADIGYGAHIVMHLILRYEHRA